MPTEKLRLPMEYEDEVAEWMRLSIPNPPPGRIYVAFTNRGRPIKVWCPLPGNAENERYFCHGLALDTFRRFRYSVFSGNDVLHVLEDEYHRVGHIGDIRHMPTAEVEHALAFVANGDVVSWHDMHGVIIHSALIVHTPTDGRRTLENVTVWSKEGFMPEVVTSLRNTLHTYAASVSLTIWRPL